ncbi:MAG: hypothetical protein JXR73_07730 [Candidatus Omnitrophica bacterium]|nr:hypothetical protein [Candidatus Omnitrophota bacterium]
MPISAVYINGDLISDTNETVVLKPDSNPILIRFDGPGRCYFILEDAESAAPKIRTPLAMSWYDRPGMIPFDAHPELENPVGWRRFIAPPGLRSMKLAVYGALQVWADGQELAVIKQEQNRKGATEYQINLNNPTPSKAVITMRIEQIPGFYGGSAIPEPVTLDCGPGKMEIGDWSIGSVLECYSGGAWYRKKVNLKPEQIQGQVLLNLGDVTASAELHVNGKLAGIRVAPPWVFDISDSVAPGDNLIEILVYNTLANHYLTIPTRYRGSLQSGLLGPVRIESRLPVVLENIRN